MLLFVTAVIGLILLDFALMGFIPSMLNLWPSLSELREDTLIEDNTVFGSIRTNVEGEFVGSMINNRVGYKSIILTSRCLVVRNTRRTYLLKVDLQSIIRYSVVKQLGGSKILLDLLIEDQEKFFRFRTRTPDIWIKAFTEIGLHPMGDN